MTVAVQGLRGFQPPAPARTTFEVDANPMI